MAKTAKDLPRRRVALLLMARVLVACVLATGAANTALAVERYYRYLNEDGVTVVDSRIPPRYVKNGYEVVTLTGRVLEVVPPAPSEEEREALAVRRQQEMELAEWDRYLMRRYTSVADIEAARERKLEDLEASLSILRGNKGTIEAQIEDVQGRAANIERAGQEVPQRFLDRLQALRKELAITQQQIDLRATEKKELEGRFEREIERFAVIKADS